MRAFFFFIIVSHNAHMYLFNIQSLLRLTLFVLSLTKGERKSDFEINHMNVKIVSCRYKDSESTFESFLM